MTKNVIETYLENTTSHQKVNPKTMDDAILLAGEASQVINLTQYMERPASTEQVVRFDDLRGFVQYVNEFKSPATACFVGSGQITVVFDYHTESSPDWLRHKAIYMYDQSERWRLWLSKNNQWLSQRDFADFLDSGLNEIIDPDQSEILNMVKNFRATINYEVDFEESSNGTSFNFKKVTKAGNTKKDSVIIPEIIKLNLQPFNGLSVMNSSLTEDKKIPAYEFRAKINYCLYEDRASEQEVLKFKVQILHIESAMEEALESIKLAFVELTNIDRIYIGGSI